MSAPGIRRSLARDVERARRAVVAAVASAQEERVYWRFRVRALQIELSRIVILIRRERGPANKERP
jgi:hypothetical protein